MTRISKTVAVALTVAALGATPLAFAQDGISAKQPADNQNMQEKGMQGDGMNGMGMMPMMNMMTQMNKMMETCNTMMQVMLQNTGKPSQEGKQPNKG